MRRFGPLLPALLLACASSQSRCGHDPQTTTTGATTESATSGSATSGSASGGSAGEIEDAAVAAIDGELRATLSAVYSQPTRTMPSIATPTTLDSAAGQPHSVVRKFAADCAVSPGADSRMPA